MNTCLPLLKRISEDAINPIVVTTNTVTGYQVLSSHSITGIYPAYLPLDYSWFVRALFKSISPRCVIIMETEFWPTLIRTCNQTEIRLWLINGRISKRTLDAPKWLKDIYRDSLQHFERITARSSSDLAALLQLGAPSNRCHQMPDLKYSFTNGSGQIPKPPLNTNSYLLCVSTHENEELQISRQWLKFKNVLPRLVLAPRHPSRIDAICDSMNQRQIPYYLHHSCSGDPNGVYLIDTLGELTPFLYHAESVFIGGSLIQRGGHNMLEAAQYQKPILIGPYHDNFKDIVNALTAIDGILVVHNVEELISQFLSLHENPQRRTQIGKHAHSLAQKNSNVHNEYYALMRDMDLF